MGRPSSYSRAVAYLESFVHYEKTPPSRKTYRTFDLAGFRGVLALLDHPQDRFSVIHVAGTKGKGSTCAMIAAILAAGGYRVGLYTSPHLASYCERIRVNGESISGRRFAGHVARIKEVLDGQPPVRDGEFRTAFEILTAAAFLEFREQKLDVAVVETGLGGSLDATNVVRPMVSALTAISLDHTELLGKTLQRIARDKSGILKKGAAAIIAPQSRATEREITRRCAMQGIRPCRAGTDWAIHAVRTDARGTRWDLVMPDRCLEGLFCPLPGLYQAENASLAVLAAQAWCKKSGRGEIPEKAIRRGLARVRWPGRFQILPSGIILDGAHNPESARRLAESFRIIFPGKKAVLLLGVSREKDVAGMLEHFSGIAAAVIATQSNTPRALPAALLARIAAKKTKAMVRCAPKPADALRQAKEMAGRDTPILVTGSLFLVGEIQGHCTSP